MRTFLLLIFTFCLVGLCKSQQGMPVSKDSIGKLLQGRWRFDTVPGRYLTIVYKENTDGSMWKDKKDVTATITDTVTMDDAAEFQLIPQNPKEILSFRGFRNFTESRPNTSDTGVCLLLNLEAMTTIFKFRYELKSISGSSFILVDLKSPRKHRKSFRLSRVK